MKGVLTTVLQPQGGSLGRCYHFHFVGEGPAAVALLFLFNCIGLFHSDMKGLRD